MPFTHTEINAQRRLAKSDWHPTKFELHHGHWRYARTRNNITSRLTADLSVSAYERALRMYAQGDLVDLGCGNAPLAGIYRDLVNSYTWVDWPGSLHQIFELDIAANLNEPLPLTNSTFDTILITSVLEHIREPIHLVAEMARILRPGGHIILGVPFMYWLHEEPHDHYRYTRHTLQHFAESNSLSVVELEETGGGLDVIADVMCKMFGKKLSKPIGYSVYYLVKFLKRIPPFGNFNRRMSKKIPLGYVAIYRKD